MTHIIRLHRHCTGAPVFNFCNKKRKKLWMYHTGPRPNQVVSTSTGIKIVPSSPAHHLRPILFSRLLSLPPYPSNTVCAVVFLVTILMYFLFNGQSLRGDFISGVGMGRIMADLCHDETGSWRGKRAANMENACSSVHRPKPTRNPWVTRWWTQ